MASIYVPPIRNPRFVLCLGQNCKAKQLQRNDHSHILSLKYVIIFSDQHSLMYKEQYEHLIGLGCLQ